MPENNPDVYLEDAKQYAAIALNEQYANNASPLAPPDFVEDDLYIVWFSKTLRNWKALISTDRRPGIYVEVTFDGNREQAYVDIYRKQSNTAIQEETLAQIAENKLNNKENAA